MTTTLLRLALVDKKCPCRPPSYGCNECCTILHDYQHGIWCEHCKGTGRVPLMPGLRVECSYFNITSRYQEGKGITLDNLREYEEYCRAGKDACKGRGWVVTTNPETIAQSLWPVLEGLHIRKLIDIITRYEILMGMGHFAEAWDTAARALEEAGLLEKVTA